ncbi:PAS domain S-box protein [Microvirga makkahensis]|uniref:Blue-light-activated histidine kinase n=1 Tax=Microvirga makkahensis TaxID=1128670 RepID=A0A7X3MVF1_9HYPH|nr:PAS domain S-box protein [Microvirga makkahensis]MXQ13891.1 PAS domain S-box protein [Microvirga makkahensis]
MQPSLADGSETGVLMRTHDWSTSPLGSPDTWPPSLRTAASLVLTSKFPMFIAWGPELAFLYNDAYAPILGSKHPRALGRPFREVWAEIWHDVGPLVAKAMAGEATFHENMHLVMERHGFPEDTWYTFSYSPIRTEDGAVAGMFCSCTETTDKVQADRRANFHVELSERLSGLSEPRAAALAAAEALGTHIAAGRAGYGEMDDTEQMVSVEQDWTRDPSVASLAGETRILDAFGPAVIAELRAGRTVVVADCLSDPRTRHEAYVSTWAGISCRSLIVTPLVKDRKFRALLYVHEATPRHWTASEVRLVERVAQRTWDAVERARIEKELRDSEALKSAIVAAALDCVVTVTEDSRVIEWNPAAERTFGYAREAALGRDLADLIIPPELREQHHRGMARYLTTGHGPVLGRRVELEAQRADGARFPAELTITAINLAGRPHFTAYLRDLTDRRRAEATLRENEQRLRATYDHAFVGIGEVDRSGHFLRVNEQLCAITGFSQEELLGQTFWGVTHPEDREADLAQFARQMLGKLDTYVLEKRYLHKNGHAVWVEVAASRVDDAAGQPLYGIRVVRDISERRKAEEHRELLIHELNHRVKNTLATVQSIVSQTLRTSEAQRETREAVENRLFALSRAHDVLTRENWEGASLHDIVSDVLEPYQDNDNRNRIQWRGSKVHLVPRMALALSMAIHELATNAAKYGALSDESGEVHLSWMVDPTEIPALLLLRWEEKGGPVVKPPSHKGFGSRLIERSLAHDLNGEVRIEYAPEGLVCSVDAPLPYVRCSTSDTG